MNVYFIEIAEHAVAETFSSILTSETPSAETLHAQMSFNEIIGNAITEVDVAFFYLCENCVS